MSTLADIAAAWTERTGGGVVVSSPWADEEDWSLTFTSDTICARRTVRAPTLAALVAAAIEVLS